jgi:ribosomal protein L20A (L18A)
MFKEIQKYDISDKIVYDIISVDNIDPDFKLVVEDIFYFKIFKDCIVANTGRSTTSIKKTKKFTDEQEFIQFIQALELTPSIIIAKYKIVDYENQIKNIKKLYNLQDEKTEDKGVSFRKTMNEVIIILVYCFLFFIPFKFILNLDLSSSAGFSCIAGLVFGILNAINRNIEVLIDRRKHD